MIGDADMPNVKDRRRLKDRILESIGKAVRHIQDCQSRSADDTVVLTNSDWQFQKLVEHLDHAFLHGLRHITNGYWVVIQEFTNKTTVKDINRMANVTTNLGRGRAWLYQALNDQLLESYTKCYLDNQQLVRKFYVKEALVLDIQRMQILLTLASGLEMTYFQLEMDEPYLDLASYNKSRNSESEETEDRISLSSMDSSLSQSSTFTQNSFDESNGPHQRSASVDQQPTRVAASLKASLSLPLFDRVLPDQPPLPTDSQTTVEVIHLPSKTSKQKKKRLHKQQSENDMEILNLVAGGSVGMVTEEDEVVSVVSTTTVTPASPESGYRSVVDNQTSYQMDSSEADCVFIDDCLTDQNSNEKLDLCGSELDRAVSLMGPAPCEQFYQSNHPLEQCNAVQVQVIRQLNWTPKELQIMESLEAETQENIANDTKKKKVPTATLR